MDRYNGWSNYPTWRLYNHLTGDPATHDRWQLSAAEAWESAGHDPDRAAYYLGQLIRDAVREDAPAGDGWRGDVAAWAVGLVEYSEIAAALLEEVAS